MLLTPGRESPCARPARLPWKRRCSSRHEVQDGARCEPAWGRRLSCSSSRKALHARASGARLGKAVPCTDSTAAHAGLAVSVGKYRHLAPLPVKMRSLMFRAIILRPRAARQGPIVDELPECQYDMSGPIVVAHAVLRQAIDSRYCN